MANPRNLGDVAPLVSRSGSSLVLNNAGVSFSGTGLRITGDMSNATFSNRLAFQSSTTNGVSGLLILPNGTATTSSIQSFNNSDPTNASVGVFGAVGSTDVRIQSSIQGTGTYLPMTLWTGGSERMRIDTSGNVAVGTTDAGTAGLSLSQNYNLSWEQSSTESVANLFRQASSAALVMSVGYKRTATANGFASSFGSSLAKTAISLGTTAGAITFYTDTAATTAVGTDVTPTERMRINSLGNVGIGTTSPSVRLDVTGNSNITNANVRVRFANTAGTPSTLLFGADSGAVWLGAETNAPIYFITNNTERMRIDSSGNVGIGRAPNYNLDVYRSGTTTATIAAANDNIVTVMRASGSTEAVIGPITSHPLVLLSANVERLRLATSGAWGLAGANYGSAGQVLASNGSSSAPTWQNAAGTPDYIIQSLGIV